MRKSSCTPPRSYYDYSSMDLSRSSGILLHISSLPSAYGIGDLGPEAYAFADFLAASRQQYWQVLPLVPTGLGHSPYSSPSTFASNPDRKSTRLNSSHVA